MSVTLELDVTFSDDHKDLIRATVTRYPATLKTADASTKMQSYQVAVDGQHKGGFTLMAGEALTLGAMKRFLVLILDAGAMKIVNGGDARGLLREQ